MARNLSSPTNPLRKLFGAEAQGDLFRALADRIDQAVLILNADGTRILTCNHILPLLTGYTREEIESMRPADLMQGEPGARALARILETSSGATTQATEIPLATRQDHPVQVDLEASPVGADGTPLLILARPSQERKRREEEASHRQTRLEGLASIARDMLQGDVHSLPMALERAQEYLAASALALYRVSHLHPDYVLDGILPDPFPRQIPASDLRTGQRSSRWSLGERPERTLEKAARAASFAELQTYLVGSKTAWVGLLVAGWNQAEDTPAEVEDLMAVLASLCHAAVQMSLQQASSAEMGAALHGLQAEASGQLNAVSDAVLGLDTDLRIVRVNAAAREMLGYPDDKLKGIEVQDVLVGPEDISSTLLDALGHDRTSERAKIVLHRRDGTPFPVHLRAVPMDKQSPTRLLVVLDDQTERQAIEDQNELLAQRALLGEVSAIFAHEVRNPINNISTGIQLVASRLGSEHPMYDSLDRVRKECHRLDQLMSDVLFFTRRLELKMEPTDLAALVQRMVERWKPRLKQVGIRAHLELEPQMPTVMADPRTLEQVFINLMTNAVQAMEEGGTLSISLAPVETPHGAIAEIRFADTGPGISQEQKDRIFDPFFTTKNDGTGLGLAISRRIITSHKGSIQVESFADAGTVFTIQLPIPVRRNEEPTS
ncbi:MAG: ATP-binding protein [Anaerolineales bacterium]